ncbi:MAG TPA: hypothetical protein VLH09_12980 [Bryobacteraceae bacterium]|nr:hypothetical protein [Bryobacteraceae bacterium]
MRKRARQPKSGEQPRTRSKWLPRAALAALALVAYSNSFDAGLFHDARVIVLEDARIRSLSAGNIAQIFTKDYWWPTPGDWIYRPVTTLSFLLNYSVLGNGPSPAGYHWISFLLHVLNVWLVYELALVLLARPAPAFFAAALWGVHPIATEAVTNVVGRADLLAALAVLAALLLYLRGAAPAILALIAGLGFLAKENAIVLPGLMLLCDVAKVGAPARPLRMRVVALASVSAALLAVLAARAGVFAQLPWPQLVFHDNILRSLGFWQARFTAIKVVGLDLWLLLWPLPLASDRSYDQIAPAGWMDVAAWTALALVAGLLILAFTMRRRSPLVFWLAGFFGIALLPTSNLVVQIGSPMAERFLYLPAMAFAVAFAALAWWRLPPRFRAYFLGAVLLLYTGRTWARNADWQSNLTLALADTKTAPRSARLHDALAKAYIEQDERRNIDLAIRAQETAWDIVRGLPLDRSSEMIPANLGAYYFAKAVQSPPAGQRAWYEKSRAVLLQAREISQVSQKRFDQAQIEHGKPLVAPRAFRLLYLFLAQSNINLGRYEDAVADLRYARSLDPLDTDVYDSLADAYRAAGKPEWASISLAQKAVALGKPFPALPAGLDPCLAASDLARAFRDHRSFERAGSIGSEAARRFGCPSAD